MKPCISPECPELVVQGGRARRCPTHEAEYQAKHGYAQRRSRKGVPSRLPAGLRRKALKRFSYRCAECGVVDGSLGSDGYPIRLQVDHADGDSGNDELLNLVPLCPRCHTEKHRRDRAQVERQLP